MYVNTFIDFSHYISFELNCENLYNKYEDCGKKKKYSLFNKRTLGFFYFLVFNQDIIKIGVEKPCH